MQGKPGNNFHLDLLGTPNSTDILLARKIRSMAIGLVPYSLAHAWKLIVGEQWAGGKAFLF